MPRDQEVRATPRNSALGALADFLAQSYSPERTQQMQGVAKFLDMPAISETIDRLSYDPSGRSLFTGAGGLGGTTRFRPEVLDAAMAVAPGAGALGKLAAQGTMAAGRAGARLAERAVPRIMERGGVGAEMLQGMSRGTVSPMDVYHGSPHKFERFDASKIGTGEGAQAYGHGLYTSESPDTAKYYQLLALHQLKADPYNASVINRFMGKSATPINNGGENLGAYALADASKAPFVYDPVLAMKNLRDKARELRIPNPLLDALGIDPTDPAINKANFDAARKYIRDFSSKTDGTGAISHFYKVDLPDEHIAKMLDWDKPLSEQPDVIKALKGTDYEVGISQKEAEKIADMRLRQEANEWAEMTGGDPVDYSNNVDWEKYVNQVRKESGRIDSNITGKDLHSMVMRDEGYRPDLFDSENYQVGASEKLRGMGIPGIKYLDANSRGGGQGTRNFVTFPGEEKNLTILERNGQPMIAPAVPEEQKMLQGFYRGYAGENLDTPELFVSPQKRIADYYADKRARQTGAEPHAEMVLMDPFAGETYGHSTMGSGAKAPMFTNAKKIKLEDIEGRTQLYQSGGVVKLLQSMLVNSGEKAITAAQRAAAGRAAAELIKSQEQVKASEALGQLMEKGFKQTTTTQADRTRVGGGNIGGAPFPALSQADPAYAGKVWGVMDEGTASRLKNLTTPDTAWTTMLGSAIQLKTNPVVFDKLKRGFIDSMKQGNLSDELAEKINHNLSLTFGKGADIRDPGIWKQADTFDKRAALADAMMGQGIAPGLGGVALGGEKSGRGVIFRPTDILKRETEPSLLHTQHGGDVPTYAAGPRLFSLEPESMYRPDLHPGFPTLIKGEDLNYNMMPTPTEVYLPDWHARFKTNNPERKAPGYYDLALGVEGEGLPSQALNNEYIRHLLREGFAHGGAVHMDEGGAAFGVFPQMKARRAQQDREAAANAPLSALRGWAAGTAGLAGDIEGLARAGISQLPPQLLTAFPALRAFGIGSRADPTPQMPTTEFYNEYLPGAQLNATPTGKLFTGAGNVLGGTGATSIARLGIKSTSELADLAARIAAEAPRSGSRAAQLGVIKMPGGNFLKGEVEDAVRPMKNNRADEANYMKFVRTQNELGDDYSNWVLNKIEQDPNFFKMPAIDTANMFLRENKQPLLPLDQINTFIDKKIVPYIKNEMATPDDPLRAMAEKYAVDKPVKLAEVQGRIDAFAAKMEQEARDRGVPVGDLTSMRQQMIGLEKEKALLEAREGLHFTPDDESFISHNFSNRDKAGTSPGGMGQSPLARSWEDVSDSAFSIETTGDILRFKDSFAPWLYKVPPETKVYRPRGEIVGRTGFNHLIDELRNATNPASGLPANLLIDPADLGKLTMPQAVDRVADINAWRATQKIEANRLLANNAATQLVKEYPEQGLKWVELKTPEAKLPEGAVFEEYNGMQRLFGPDGESLSIGATKEEAIKLYQRKEREKQLEDALKYEGDTMAHCVGGYCPDVVEGRSRIYSLRDDKGQPRVTIEVGKHNPNLDFQYAKENLAELYAKYRANRNDYFNSWPDFLKKEAPELLKSTESKIIQIKGKGNRKPADEFLPFVQDFVKSGKWSDVGDLQNTGLYSAKDVMNYMPETFTMSRNARQLAVGRARQAQDLPDYMTKAEYEAILQKHAPEDIWRAEKAQNAAEDDELLRQLRPPPEGFAQGGMVSSNQFDPIKIKQIIASLDDDYDPENIQQIIAHQESSYA